MQFLPTCKVVRSKFGSTSAESSKKVLKSFFPKFFFDLFWTCKIQYHRLVYYFLITVPLQTLYLCTFEHFVSPKKPIDTWIVILFTILEKREISVRKSFAYILKEIVKNVFLHSKVFQKMLKTGKKQSDRPCRNFVLRVCEKFLKSTFSIQLKLPIWLL